MKPIPTPESTSAQAVEAIRLSLQRLAVIAYRRDVKVFGPLNTPRIVDSTLAMEARTVFPHLPGDIMVIKLEDEMSLGGDAYAFRHTLPIGETIESFASKFGDDQVMTVRGIDEYATELAGQSGIPYESPLPSRPAVE